MADGTVDTRQLILRIAEELFVRHGFNAVSMNQLVDEVSKVRKLSKPAIYYHFEDKEALYAAVMREILERQGRILMEASTEKGDLRGCLQALVAGIQRGATGDFPRLVRDFHQALGEDARAQMDETFQRAIIQPIIAVFARAAASGELRPDIPPHLAARAFIPLAVSLQFDPATGEPSGTPPALVASIFLDGIAAHEC